ncbi:MAG: chemotaxis protein CheD [Pseudooceanicola sp.]
MRQVSANSRQVTITQGEFAVASSPGTMFSTILGSCVATCLWDPRRGIGGMNHILVARSQNGPVRCDAAGVNAMELLINGLVRLGASRGALQAKLFGGAKMVSGLSDIGRMNAIFALEFLEREGIPCLGKSLGGVSARQVRFFPVEGRAQLKLVAPDAAHETLPVQRADETGNDVELF